jgi:hypothetical protein
MTPLLSLLVLLYIYFSCLPPPKVRVDSKYVRQFPGYDRFDKPEFVGLINDLYKHEWSLFTNYFCRTLKLTDKTKINSRYVKTYEPPKTHCQRLLDSEHISSDAKKHLQEVYYSLNPFTLKSKIEEKLKAIFATLRLLLN